MSVNLQLNLDFLRFRWRPLSSDPEYSTPGFICDWWDQEGYSQFLPDSPFILKAFFYRFRGFLHIFDYDSFDDESGEVVLGWKRIKNYQHYDCGVFGINSIMILFDFDNWEKGVTVSVPSSGLWIIKDWFSFSSFHNFLKYLRLSGVHFTRLDICFDDFLYREEGHFKAHDFIDFWNNKQFVTRCKRHKQYDDFSMCDEVGSYYSGSRSFDWDGSSFYLGSRQSERMLRIYDKFVESALKAKRKNDDSLFVDSVRYEFEIHEGYADSLVQALISPDHSFTIGDFCNNWFRIVDRSHSKNTSNTSVLPVLQEWNDFINLEFSEDLNREAKDPELLNIWLLRKHSSDLVSRQRYFDKALTELFMRKLIDVPDWEDWIRGMLYRIRAGDVSDSFKQDIIDHYHTNYHTAIGVLLDRV